MGGREEGEGEKEGGREEGRREGGREGGREGEREEVNGVRGGKKKRKGREGGWVRKILDKQSASRLAQLPKISCSKVCFC